MGQRNATRDPELDPTLGGNDVKEAIGMTGETGMRTGDQRVVL